MKLNFKRVNPSFIFLLLIILLICMGDVVFFIKNRQLKEATLSIIISYGLFLLPVVLFRNYLRLYAWLLTPVILMEPFTLASIIFYNVPINDSIVLLAVNSNPHEAYELLRGFILPFIFLFCSCVAIYLVLVNKVSRKISV